jgi:hypothetical protein
MKRPTLTAALATKTSPPPAEAAHHASASRVNTTLRLPPETLEALKVLAARKRVRVNDLVLEGVAHILALHAETLRP